MSRSKKNQRKKKQRKINTLKLIISLLVFILLICILVSGVRFGLKVLRDNTSTPSQSNSEQGVQVNNTIDKPQKVTLSVVGDVMTHQPQLTAQYDSSKKSYSFDNNFKYIKSHIEKSDLSIANLETTLSGTSIPYSSYPRFNSPDALAQALKNSGFDILSTINNHTFDNKDLGFERTISVLEEMNFDIIGSRKNVEDKDYLVKTINDIDLGITSFSYGEIKNSTKYLNGIEVSEKSKDKINVFDMYNVDNAFNTINDTLKNMDDTDIQIVLLHWGDEYKRVPSDFQTKLAQKLSDAGVDIIIGSHPHVVQPVEMIKSSDKKSETLVIYSLGNFISNQRKELLGTSYTEDGLMVDIELTRDPSTGNTFVSNVNCIPTWVNRYQGESNLVYEVIPIEDKNFLYNTENLPIDKLKLSYENTTSLIKTSKIIHYPQNLFN